MRAVYLIIPLCFFFLFLSPVRGEEAPDGPTAPPPESAPKESAPDLRLKGRIAEGIRLMRQKRWEEAVRLFEDLARRFPNSEEVYYELGIAYLELGQVPKGEEALKRALRIKPNYTAASLELALLYEETQRLREAVEIYDRIIQTDPLGDDIQFSLLKKNLIEGILMARSGDLDGALRLFRTASEFDPNDPVAHYNIGLIFLKKKETAKAEEAFRKVVSLNPQHQEAYLQLGNMYEQQKRIPEALQAFIGAAQVNPNTPGGRSAQVKVPLLRGIVLAREGKVQEALLSFQQALRITPDPAPIYFNIGMLYLGTGSFQDAEAAFNRTLEFDPKHQGALLNLGILYERQGKLEEALRVYEAGRDAQPASPEGINAAVSAETVKGRIAINAGAQEEAVEAFKRAIALQPKNPANYFNLALAHLRRNDLEEAEKAFDQVIAIDPSEGDAYLPLADILERSGREEEAIETYERLIALGQGALTTRAQVRLHLLKGTLFEKQERTDDAEKEYQEVVRVDPQEKAGYANLVRVYLKKKDPYAAIGVYKKAIEVDPKDQPTRLKLAQLYEELARPNDAFDLYQGVLEEGTSDAFAEEIQERINLLFGTIFVGYQVTYDSNINLSEHPIGDLKSEVIGQYQRFFLYGSGWRSGIRLTPVMTVFHHDQVSVFNGEAGAVIDWRGYKSGLTLGYNLYIGYFEGSLSSRSQELSLDAFSPAGESSTFTGSLRIRYYDSVTNDTYDAFQPSLSAGLAFDQVLGGRLSLNGAVYANFNTKAVGDDYANVGFAPSLLFDRPLMQGILLNLSYGYTTQSYLNPDSVFHDHRLSQGHSFGAGITVYLERGVQFYLKGSWQTNSSNLGGTPPELATILTGDRVRPLTDYTKWIGMFGIRLIF